MSVRAYRNLRRSDASSIVWPRDRPTIYTLFLRRTTKIGNIANLIISKVLPEQSLISTELKDGKGNQKHNNYKTLPLTLTY